MTRRFWKYHGTGNDFVMLLDLEDREPLTEAFAAAVCDRRFGIGADGVIRVTRAGGGDADLVMDHRNADGSLAEMCGNGIRCLAALVHDEGVTTADHLLVATRSGVRTLVVDREGDAVRAVTVGMGPARLRRGEIGMTGPADESFVGREVSAAGYTAAATAVSMGNPHLVLFVEDPDGIDVREVGPALERDPMFTAGANVEFVTVRDGVLHARVWERGVGETLACGTGACAVLVAAHEAGLSGPVGVVRFPGGQVVVDRADDEVFLTGPAERVAEGTLDARWMATRGLA